MRINFYQLFRNNDNLRLTQSKLDLFSKTKTGDGNSLYFISIYVVIKDAVDGLEDAVTGAIEVTVDQPEVAAAAICLMIPCGCFGYTKKNSVLDYWKTFSRREQYL